MEETKQLPYYEFKNEKTGEVEKIPRVTSILDCVKKPGLDHWRGYVGNKEADRIAKEGAQIGRDFHTIAADINRGMHHKHGWRAEARFREMSFAYIDWLHANVQEIVEVEKLIRSGRYGYAGTTDLVAILRGDSRPAIIDVKTSNAVDITWPLQLSAYQTAIEDLDQEVYKDAVDLRRIIIRIPKKGECVPEMYEYYEHQKDKEAWLNVLNYWRWTQGNKDRVKRAKKQ